ARHIARHISTKLGLFASHLFILYLNGDIKTRWHVFQDVSPTPSKLGVNTAVFITRCVVNVINPLKLGVNTAGGVY
ncbi:hypothetical protein BGY98DRAFT_983291, partial [Russula aff. rugulosa BPL654]